MGVVKFLSGALVLLVAGCVSAPMQIAGLEFVNETDLPISDVELRVVKTYEVASCNYIPAGAKFSTQFPLMDYRGNEVEVVWKDRAGKHHFGPTVIVSPDPVPEDPVIAVIALKPAGRATARFRKE